MKKILLAAVILLVAAPQITVWAQASQGKETPQWVLDHQKNTPHGRHVKKTKPPRKIAGTVKKGAPQVSPAVVKKAK